MNRLDLLRQLQLGSDVAEHDRGLELYFVPTASYRHVVGDEVDVVIGPKGSGKTAIFRYLTNEHVDIPELDDVDMIPAFNAKGAVLFRRMVEHIPSDEESLRIAWLAYVTAIVGNHVVHTYASTFDAGGIQDWLMRAGLLFTEKDSEPSGILNRIMSRMGTEARSGKIELRSPELKYAPSMMASIDFEKKHDHPQELAQINYEQGLELSSEVLIAARRRCWILFDRLDESFLQDERFEIAAIRGLLRAYLDLVSLTQNVRSKIFIRTDSLDRVTRAQKFVNTTHLRLHRLRWDGNEIVALVANRLMENDEFRRHQDLSGNLRRSLKGRKRICLALFPGMIRGVAVWRWLFSHTVDAYDELSPRNCLTLLNYAKDRQVDYLSSGSAYGRQDALIEAPAMTQAAIDLSRARLEDTIYAEHPHLRRHVESLRDIPATFDRADLCSRLQLTDGSVQSDATLSSLEQAGMLRVLHNGEVYVPLLYRNALTGAGTTAGTLLEQIPTDDQDARRRRGSRSRRKSRREAISIMNAAQSAEPSSQGYLGPISIAIHALIADPSSRRMLESIGIHLSLIREAAFGADGDENWTPEDEQKFTAAVAVVAMQSASGAGRLIIEYNNDNAAILFLRAM